MIKETSGSNQSKQIIINNIAYIDGGRIPKTSKTTIGGIIYVDGRELIQYSDIGGDGGSTDAEFFSLIKCLDLAKKYGLKSLRIKTDSKIVGNIFKTEYDVISAMIYELENNPDNKGLYRAISKRAKERFSNIIDMQYWLNKNQDNLKSKSACNPKYKDQIDKLIRNIHISIEHISREENSIADGLCRKARKKIN